MAEAAELLTGKPSIWFIPIFGFTILGLLVFASYKTLARTFKWLTLVLFAYVAAAFLARPDWSQVLRATISPRVAFDKDYLMTFVGILGTTISPYLFFWQASEEVEEEKLAGKVTIEQRIGATDDELRRARNDVAFGMTVSNAVAYFIVLTTGATLYAAGRRDVQTARDAAEALRPLAGNAAYLLFACGLIGTGFLGVPVLAGSAAYAVAEAGAWRGGINEKFGAAKKFYAVIAAAMIVGMLLDYAGFNAIKLLFWAAILNGVLAAPLVVIILLICNNPEVMGERTNNKILNVLGVLTALVMSAAAIAALADWWLSRGAQ